MSVSAHQQSFESIYKNLRSNPIAINFPLNEIENYEWGRGPQSNSYFSYFYRRFTCHMLKDLDLSDGQRVLVVGCGKGNDEKNIKNLFPNCELWSVDISLSMVKLAVESNSPSTFCLSAAEQLPFPDNSFDRVVSREVIEHVMRPDLMIQELARVLKPGGRAVVTTENEESLSHTNFYSDKIKPLLAKMTFHKIPEPRYKDDAPTPEEIEDYVEKAQLQLTDYYFDGGAYKSGIGIARHLRLDADKLAHRFSALENNRTISAYFCDQAKYVIDKPQVETSTTSTPSHVCPACNAELQPLDARAFKCSSCSKEFPIQDGVPNFIVYEEAESASSPRDAKEGSNLIFRALNFACGGVYLLIYFALASVLTLFIKSNKDQISQRIPKTHYLYQFLKAPKA